MIQKGLDASCLEEAYQNNYPEHDSMLASEDALEGSRAFIEKRKPVWQGK
jgi:enoyl-CoA hydratase/carnithine racemase